MTSLALPLPRTGRLDLPVALTVLGALLLWDASALDMWLLQPFATLDGFALQEHWLAQGVLHDGGRLVGWFVLALLLINLWRPLWPGLAASERWRWLAMTLACVLVVSLVKRSSPTSCPWDLNVFGGVARRLSHWRWATPDDGPGGCFPSGHAAVAFAFFSGYFSLRQAQPAMARRWLAAVCALGLTFGAAQMMRGAHFASHTLWTAWLCWALCALTVRLWPAPSRHRLAFR